MPDSVLTTQVPLKTEEARDVQARLYREIGITAVAAALRFTTQPEPVEWPTRGTMPSNPRRDGIAA